MTTVIKNGTVYQNGQLIHADILVAGKKLKLLPSIYLVIRQLMLRVNWLVRV